MPFWEIGFVFVALRLWRQESVQPKNMMEGFRRFRQVMGLRLTELCLYVGAAFGCAYAASFIFAATSFIPIIITPLFFYTLLKKYNLHPRP